MEIKGIVYAREAAALYLERPLVLGECLLGELQPETLCLWLRARRLPPVIYCQFETS